MMGWPQRLQGSVASGGKVAGNEDLRVAAGLLQVTILRGLLLIRWLIVTSGHCSTSGLGAVQAAGGTLTNVQFGVKWRR